MGVVIAAAVLVLAGCGGGGDGGEDVAEQVTDTGSAGSPPSTSQANRPPKISGSPSPAAVTGRPYSFTPSVEDPDHDRLTFSVANLPPWARFDPWTGRISGTPGPGDVGHYPKIRLSVWDGTASVNLPAFSIEVVDTASGAVTLVWHPPTENVDGSPLLDLDGYRIYWGQSEHDLMSSITLSNPGLTSYVVDELTPGTWYFAMTAFNSHGMESSYSNVVSKEVM